VALYSAHDPLVPPRLAMLARGPVHVSSAKKVVEMPTPRHRAELAREAAIGKDERTLTTRASQVESVRQYAHCKQDLLVLLRVVELASFDIPRYACSEIALQDGPADVLRLTLEAMKLLHLCDYAHEEVCCILAHATVYLVRVVNRCGEKMDNFEIGHVMVLLMFIAHSYLLDETCPLRIWHSHIMKDYCSVRVLNSAVFRLMYMRKFNLSVNDEDVRRRHAYLIGPTPAASPPSSNRRSLGPPAA
jgi:hypothetical protein